MCKACGYQLTAPGICPECGTHNSAEDLASPPFREQRQAASPLNPFRWLATKHGATAFACLTAFLLAVWPINDGWPNTTTGQPMNIIAGIQHILETGGTGGLLLWPLFGATNQLLAGFAFVVITMWLITKRKPVWMIVPPAVIMLIVPAAAMSWQAFIGNDANPSWLSERNLLLVAVAALTLALEAWLIGEVALHWKRRRPHDALEP
jgi:carbon starvation protein